MNPLRIVTIPGSLRAQSYNRKLLRFAEQFLGNDVELDRIDLKDFPIPPYDGDLQDQGMPPMVEALKDRIRVSHGLLISAPEYNYGVAGMWKNVFDWTTRGASQPWPGKVVGIMGASNGPIGTWRATMMYRQMYAALGAIVLPQSFNLSHAPKAWDESGKPLDESLPGRMEKFVEHFLALVRQIHNH